MAAEQNAPPMQPPGTDMTVISFRDQLWINSYPLDRNYVFDYFALSPFYDITCNNEMLRRRSIHPLDRSHLSKMTGLEYVIRMSWSKILALDLSPGIEMHPGLTFLLDEEKKVVMICETWYNFEDEPGTRSNDMIYIVGEDNEVTVKDFGIDTLDGCVPVILDYVPSLARIERAGGKKKRM
ncbi:unnamed protein product [Thlaspi arvense]|uniref:Mediator of RNA polymerase II transcription subunit 6 n=1 Tax=Thlaspi arvense TaxID=13288 RepID=A0AAU9RYS5_THLAR|nr:unnamed protein product [Thlaspi arvense]